MKNTPGQSTQGRFISILLAGLSIGVVGHAMDQPARAGSTKVAAVLQNGFKDVTTQAGVTNTHHRPVLDRQLDGIMSWVCSVGAAAAAADFNHDGWIDLYVTDSHQGFPNHLYKNNGNGTFTDVAPQAGVAEVNTDEKGASMDCVWGDYDNDGWADLFVVRWGRNSLFRNNGDGTFTEVTDKLFRKIDGSPGVDWANGCAAIFLDYNMDGRVDIYVGNYFANHDLWHLKTTRIMHDNFEKARNAGVNFLYRQNPDGTFTDVAPKLGLDDPGWTLAVGAADLNNDGWPDVYCADDFGPDQLFLNNRDGTFTNITETAIGYDTKKGMNVDFGDIDNDGWLDMYVSNITTSEYLQEGNMLWHNNGIGPDGNLTFADIALETGTYDGGWSWGQKFFDPDNDGDLDIILVNGFISAGSSNYWYDLASWTVKGQDVDDAKNWPVIGDRSFSGYEKNRFWRNDGQCAFSERAHEYGLDSDRDGRGVVCFDYDNDGDLDLFIANQNQPPQLLRNDLKNTNHWIWVQLEGDTKTGVTRDAMGARATIVTAAGRQLRENNGGKSYCGQSDPRLHFGLGPESRVKLIEVRWPDGGLQYLEDVPTGQVVAIRQDPRRYTTQLAMKPTAAKTWQKASTKAEPAVPKLSAEELEQKLVEMESKLSESLGSYKAASAYRKFCASYNRHDRAIAFFKSMAAKDNNNQRARFEYSCALVDKIPTCGGMAAIVSKGTLAAKSLDQINPYIAAEPESWVGYYTRAMNHLHWPRALLHSGDSIKDFLRCVELQKKSVRPDAKPCYVRVWIGLGDACTKNKQADKARKAWSEGLQAFPKSEELKARLAIKDDGDLLAYVESQRSLEQPIDTDFSFMDTEWR